MTIMSGRVDPIAVRRPSQLFQTFRRTGSASATVQAFPISISVFLVVRATALTKRYAVGRLEHRAARVLHNPAMGRVLFGRSRQRHPTDSRVVSERLPRRSGRRCPERAFRYITGVLEGISAGCAENAQAIGPTDAESATRGRLFPGLAVCGIFWDRMTVRITVAMGPAWPTYVCQRRGIAQANDCPKQPGPRARSRHRRGCSNRHAATLGVTLTVQQELQTRPR